MNAQDIQAIEPMTFEHTGGGIHTLFTGTPDAEGYYDLAIGPFTAEGEMGDVYLTDIRGQLVSGTDIR